MVVNRPLSAKIGVVIEVPVAIKVVKLTQSFNVNSESNAIQLVKSIVSNTGFPSPKNKVLVLVLIYAKLAPFSYIIFYFSISE